MKKTILCGAIVAMTMSSALAGECNFTPEKNKFSFGFTAYGLPDKSYDVENNTFKEFELSSDSGKLLDASIKIKTDSLDTSADPRNWDRSGNWPEATIQMRNQNVINGLFHNFKNGDMISAKIASIDKEKIELAVTMNDVTKNVAMPYKIEDGVLKAKGKLELTDFDTDDAMKAFAAVCSNVWHKGKTWTDVDIYFSVPVQESACQ